MAIRIAPSILSADFANLEKDILKVARADWLHVDVMDGHFVPNMTLGLPVVRRLVEVSPIPVDVHLMIEDPERWAPRYAEAGAKSVTFHAEAALNPVPVARSIRDAGARAALALKPGTPVEPFLAHLSEFDMVLIMTVEPGFGGQEFMPETLPKFEKLRNAARDRQLDLWLQADGGVSEDTIERIVVAGGDTLVAGSAVFDADDPAERVAALRAIAEAAHHR